jgi:flagellar protein FlaI
MPLIPSIFRQRLGSPTRLLDESRLSHEGRRRPPEEWRVLAHYTVGPVKYFVYRDEAGGARLMFIEPEPVDEALLRDMVAGLAEPETPEERYYYEKAVSGYGPLYPLIIDSHVEEIAVEGAGKEVSIIHKLFTGRWISVDLKLTEEEVDSLAIQLSRKAGRPVSLAVPIAEGLTADGHRVAVTFSRHVSRFGSSFVIRKYPEKPVTLGDLIAGRVLSPLAAAYLWMLVESQQFLIIVGSMGAGKTTLLQALAGLIPPFYRVVTIEDTPELRLPVPRWDALVTRPSPPGEEIEEIGLEDLLKFALRRRAEYIIVGEVRGREARLLAQAAASGHGSMTTMHADSPEGAVLRLQLEPISLPPLFLTLIGAIVHIRRIPAPGGRARRKVFSIAEIQGDEIVHVVRWIPHEDRFEPETAKELVERSESLERARERLPDLTGNLVDELEERAALLEKLAGEPPEAFMRGITRFYVERYGKV